jgi:hypothetical protein
VRHGEWHGHTTGLPDAPLNGDVLEARRELKGDACLVKVRSATAGYEVRCDAPCGIRQVGVRVAAALVDHGGAAEVARGSTDNRNEH